MNKQNVQTNELGERMKVFNNKVLKVPLQAKIDKSCVF
ncbi:hypothetical protein Fluta_2728 [Fluviicola taffensis DSM 16823]|uniref:Uncharacterized protein n=1 Tax=Fluviicola taffensis (strain DSM 16823 / NCIMB 13979 / RW262) TaxID=755732 RepID=F2IG74_FLUTR|nr:hypothetical protein Fluta_2728 [Fluviicola taffensis DSM 16823]